MGQSKTAQWNPKQGTHAMHTSCRHPASACCPLPNPQLCLVLTLSGPGPHWRSGEWWSAGRPLWEMSWGCRPSLRSPHPPWLWCSCRSASCGRGSPRPCPQWGNPPSHLAAPAGTRGLKQLLNPEAGTLFLHCQWEMHSPGSSKPRSGICQGRSGEVSPTGHASSSSMGFLLPDWGPSKESKGSHDRCQEVEAQRPKWPMSISRLAVRQPLTSVTFHPSFSFILLMCLHPKSSDIPLPSVKSHRRSDISLCFRKSTSTVQTEVGLWRARSRAGAQVVTGRPIKRLMLLSRQEMMRPKLRQWQRGGREDGNERCSGASVSLIRLGGWGGGEQSWRTGRLPAEDLGDGVVAHWATESQRNIFGGKVIGSGLSILSWQRTVEQVVECLVLEFSGEIWAGGRHGGVMGGSWIHRSEWNSPEERRKRGGQGSTDI